MKRQYVNVLQDGDFVNDYFVASRKELRSKQDGSKFLGMVFKDRTGDIGGIMWNNANEMAKVFELGDVVNVRGRVSCYQNRLQIQVDQVLPLKDGEFDTNDLVFTPENTRQDLDNLRGILESVTNPWLRQLNDLFMNDADFLGRFTSAAAGKKWHHEYRGGLLRHCYEMMRIAQTMCELYPELDQDVLITGIFLHDLGKIHEMSHNLFVEYTSEGKLLGHLHIGAEMALDKLRQIENFPKGLRMQLLHCILSHHGELTNGSPVVPKTLEAIVLHHIDNLDAQAAAISRVLRETREKRQEWSEYLPLIERDVWTKGLQRQEAASRPAAPAQAELRLDQQSARRG